MGRARLAAALLVTVVCLAEPFSARGASPTLLRYPYLTDVVASWATVSLATDTTSPGPLVSWGLASGDCTAPPNSVTATYVTSFGTGDKQFKAHLTGLQANTPYCYRVTQAGVDLLGSSPVFTSALASGSTDPFTFAVIGDWGAGTADESRVIAQIAAARPSFVVTVGDNVYNSGTQAEYGDIRGGSAFAPQYWPQVGRTIPAFPAEGNHGFSGSLPYFQNWPQDGIVADCAQSGCRYQRDSYCCTGTLGSSSYNYPSSWYAFDWGNSRFYVLEGAWSDSTGAYLGDFQARWNGSVSGCSFCGAEQTWLANDLASHSAAHKFAFFHYPLHSDSTSQASDSYLAGPSSLEGLLATNGVHIVFNGHAHDYERNLPQIAGNPMVSYVTGGGGDALGSVTRRSAFDAYARAVFHYLNVSVTGSSITVTPIDENGATFDVQTYNFTSPSTDDFSIAASPSLLNAMRGLSTTSTISSTVVSGSAQTVSLSASGLPSGATATLNPASVTSGSSSTLTISTSASTPAGTYPVTVTGAGASATHTTTVTLTVMAPDDFSIAAGPSTVGATQGQSATSTISTTVVSGSGQNVTLSASGLPSGATATFNPSSISAGGSSTLTIGTGVSTPAGTYAVTVTGAGTSATHTTTVTLTVNASAGSVPRFVQGTTAGESASSTSITATFSAATQPGDLLVLSAGVYTGATNQISKVTDAAGNAWTRIGAYCASGHYSDGEMWYAPNTQPVTAVTVTVATAAVVAIEVLEFAGVAASNPLDRSAGTSNTGVAADSGEATPTGSNDLAVAFVAGHGSAQPITITAVGFTSQPQQGSTNAGSTPVTVVVAYRTPAVAGAQDASGTFSSAMYWAAGIVLFKSA